MVFSSLPSYVDPPNWPNQQPAGGLIGHDHGGTGGSDHEICQLPPVPLLPPPPPFGSGGDARSLQILEPERMHMTKLSQPADTPMKCPRCESTNTKFCYFNNYSLSQPRHFCKTCRRYWTRGGALRNVPVGGGCRRNKKSNKGSRVSRSKSPSATVSSTTSNTPATDILGHLSPHFPILPPLHHFGGGDLGVTYGGGNGTHDLFKFSHFPSMEGSSGGMYGEGPSNYTSQVGGMKLEEISHQNQQQHQDQMNLSRNFLGISGNDQFLGTTNISWGTTDLRGFTSSSTTTTHLL